MKPVTKGLLLLAGVVIPSTLAAMFVFGCCVLPFHRFLHGTAPLCHTAAGILAGHHDGDEHGDHHPATPPPAREKSSLSSPTVLTPNAVRLFLTADGIRQQFDVVRSGHRSVISLGATRCESDVGLQLLLTTFRI